MSVLVSDANAVWTYCTLAREAKKQTVCMMRFMVDVLEVCEERSAEKNRLQREVKAVVLTERESKTLQLIDELAKTDQVRRNYWIYRKRKLRTEGNMKEASK